MGYIINIEQASIENKNFRKVLYTAKNSQLVVMSLLPKEEIGEEIHQLDQFIRVESGHGKAVLNDKEYELSNGFAVVIPAGTKHNIINTSEMEEMKLYTVYSPPNHKDGTIHATKEVAEANEATLEQGERSSRRMTEHFDGKTTE